jgi:hypothetical protein
MAGFDINNVEPSYSATRELLARKMNLMEIYCDDGRWIELAQYRVQWWALVLAVLNLCVLLPES